MRMLGWLISQVSHSSIMLTISLSMVEPSAPGFTVKFLFLGLCSGGSASLCC